MNKKKKKKVTVGLFTQIFLRQNHIRANAPAQCNVATQQPPELSSPLAQPWERKTI